MRQRSYRRRVSIVVLLIAAAVVLVVLRGRLRMGGDFHVTGDPLDIRFVGVQPDAGDDLYDAKGTKIGTLAASLGESHWDPTRLKRDFIFDVHEADESILFTRWAELLALDGSVVGSGYVHPLGHSGGVRRFIVRSGFPKTKTKRFLYLWTLRVPVRGIDIVLSYHLGPRGKADVSFTGPFKRGRKVLADGGQPCELTPDLQWGTPWDPPRARFHLSVKQAFMSQPEQSVLVYDVLGHRHLVQSGSGSWGSSGAEVDFEVPGLKLDQVAAVTIGEKPRQKRFHNVVVRYRSRPERDHAEYLDKMAAALNLTGLSAQQLAEYTLRSPEEAVRVIDIVRAHHIHRAHALICWGDPRIKLSELPKEDQDRVRRTAMSWTRTEDPRVQRYGVELGLITGKWPEFVDRAIELLHSRDSEARRGSAYALVTRSDQMLTPQHIEKIKQYLLTQDESDVVLDLLRCLWTLNTPERTQALRELAQDDRVWLWWAAIDRRPWWGEQKAVDALPDKIKARFYLVYDAGRTPSQPAVAAQADALLPDLLTPRLYTTNSAVFSAVRDRIIERLGPKKGTEAMVRFLRGFTDFPNRGDSGAIAPIVQQINLWHTLNLGCLGADVKHWWEYEAPGHDWEGICDEVVGWFETGVDPRTIPAGYAPKPADLRVVWRNTTWPETSVIGVWLAPVDPNAPALWTRLSFTRDFLDYQIVPGDEGVGPKTHLLRLLTGVIKSRSSYKELSVSATDLPMCVLASPDDSSEESSVKRLTGPKQGEPAWEGRWEVWLERFDARDGALSGTEVFDAWCKTYLASIPQASSRPCVFHRHTKDASRRFMLTGRSYAGWTAVEIAFRETMDYDPHFARDVDPNDANPREAVVRWQALLQRNDLTDVMRVFAWWRLGENYFYAHPRDTATRPSDDEEGFRALEQVRLNDPNLVSKETLDAAVTIGQRVLSGTWSQDGDHLHRLASAYRWAMSHTDTTVNQSVARVNRHLYILPEKLLMDYRDAPDTTESKRERLQRDLANTRRRLAESITYRVRNDRNVKVLGAFLDSLNDVAPAEQMNRWRQALAERTNRRP